MHLFERRVERGRQLNEFLPYLQHGRVGRSDIAPLCLRRLDTLSELGVFVPYCVEYGVKVDCRYIRQIIGVNSVYKVKPFGFKLLGFIAERVFHLLAVADEVGGFLHGLIGDHLLVQERIGVGGGLAVGV